MKIIGLHGKARSGKDEVAHIMCSMFDFEQVAFAGKLKEYSKLYFGLTDEQIYDKKTQKSRKILQALGAVLRDHIVSLVKEPSTYTKDKMAEIVKGYFGYKTVKGKAAKEVLDGLKKLFSLLFNDERLKRDIDSFPSEKDIWIYLLFRDLKHEDKVFVVSDLRYKNEYNYIKVKDGKTIKIEREDKPKIEAGEQHQSEIDLDDIETWDAVITNYAHKDWHELLVTQTTNIIRDLVESGFFSSEDIERFNVTLDRHS